jgi:hypothetical protein
LGVAFVVALQFQQGGKLGAGVGRVVHGFELGEKNERGDSN